MNLNNLTGHIPNAILSLLSAVLSKYDINTPYRTAHFIGNIYHESSNFTTKTENLNYSHAQHIVDTWHSRFNLDGSGGKLNANDYVGNPQKLANAVYDGRMGNTEPNDGYTYRGGGFLQLTGKAVYTEYANHINTSIDNAAHLVQTDNSYALDSTAWMWTTQFKLNAIADGGISNAVIAHIRRIVNGGIIGLDDVIKEVDSFYSLIIKP